MSMNNDTFYCPFSFPASEVILENNLAFAIYDKYPVSKGHALVIPKRHVANYFELTIEEQTACHLLLNMLKKMLHKKYNPSGYNVGINIDESAGQTVPHTSIHLIPRYKTNASNPSSGVRNVIAQRADYLNYKEKWASNSPSNYSNIQPKSDKERMWAFYCYLNELVFHNKHFIDVTLQCIDANNNIVPVQHENIYEAFVAGCEIAISLSCMLKQDDDGKYLFVDNEWRVHKNVDYKAYLDEYSSLVPYEQDTMVLTMQNEFKIKRFGIVERTTSGTSVFFEHPLYKEITDAMQELVDGF